MFQYPYGDSQQLNLDWLMEQWQETKVSIDGSLQGEIDRVEAAITDLLTARDQAVAAKTAAESAATSAAGYAGTASGAASTATAQAAAAAASAALAGNHASNAQTSETNAGLQAMAAGNSASAAATSATNARNSELAAAASSSAAAGNALYAEGMAKGTQNGTPVTSGSPYYEDNSAYWAGEAQVHASNAVAAAYYSEAMAKGTVNGTPVASGEPGYEDNAEYYKDQAAAQAAAAAASAASADGAAAQAMIAQVEASSTASAAHAAGTYFRLNGVLYMATQDIAVGATITPGTNCSVAVLGNDVSELKTAINEQSEAINNNCAKVDYLKTSDFRQGGYGRDGQFNSSANTLVSTANPIPDWVDEIIISSGFAGILFIFDSNNTYYGGTYSDYLISGGYYYGTFYFTDYFDFKYFKTAYKNLNFYLCVKKISGANLAPSEMTNVVKLTQKIETEQANSYSYGFYNGDLLGNERKDFIISIGHGGGYTTYPFNTAPNFIEASNRGLLYVEGDVSYTSDNVPVMCHDRTINGQARNPDGTEITDTIYLADITYAEANEYDWGIYKGDQFAGTKLLKFEDWILLCKQLSLVPCIELKRESQNDPDIHTQVRVNNLVSILKAHNMLDKCFWASFDREAMFRVKKVYPKANTGITITSGNISSTVQLNTCIGFVRGLRYFGGMSYVTAKKEDITQTFLDALSAEGIPLIEYFINSAASAEAIKGHAPLMGGYTDYAVDIGAAIKDSIVGT